MPWPAGGAFGSYPSWRGGLLADEESDSKLVLIGIPGTGESLIELAHDVATRVDVFRLPPVSDALIDEMIRKGEQALNVEFVRRSSIMLAAAGSLLTAQTLCWELVAGYRVERTRGSRTPIGTDIGAALTARRTRRPGPDRHGWRRARRAERSGLVAGLRGAG